MRKKICLSLVILFLFVFRASAAAEVEIIINIPAFTLHVYEGGVCLKSYPISIGRELNPSILGETHIINKVVDPTYYPPDGSAPIPPGPNNPVGTRWLGLDFPGYGIHGTNNPASIGSAASLGCIRMLNKDVEELTSLVRIGTPVRLIYQTVLLEEDPLLHTKTVTIFPDIYNQGVTEKQLASGLSKKWENVYQPALTTLLKNPTGKPEPLPWAVPLYLEEEPLELKGVKWGGKKYLPWDWPFDPRLPFADQLVKWGEEYFLPLESYLAIFGLSYEKTQGGWHIKRPTAFLAERPLGEALVYQEQIYLTAEKLPQRLNPTELKVLLFWGKIYYPADLFLEGAASRELRLLLPDAFQPVTGEQPLG